MALAQAAGGLDRLIAKKSPSYKLYRDRMTTEEGIIEAFSQEPRLIRRPIWVGEDGVRIGFNSTEWADPIR